MTEVLQTLVDALSLGSLYGIFALGIALVYGIMRLLNFAHGELVMVGAYAAAMLSGMPAVIAIPLALIVVVAFALAMEALAFRPVRSAAPATLLTTSFAVSFALQALAGVVFGTAARPIRLGTTLDGSIQVAGLRIDTLDIVTVAATAVLLIGLVLFLGRSLLGLQLRAASEDFTMARLLGVRGNTVIMLGFGLAGLLAGVAAVIVGMQTGFATPYMGVKVIQIAFIATIIGGIGSLSGALLGGYALGILTVALQTYLPEEWRPFRDVLVFAVVLMVLVARPEGLIPGRGVDTARSY